MKKLLVIFLSIFLFIDVSALTVENLYLKEDGVKNIYYFKTNCVHCKEAEAYFKTLDNVKIHNIELDTEGLNLAKTTLKELKSKESLMVPLIVIDEEYYMGFSKTIEKQIDNYLKGNKKIFNIPLIGKTDGKRINLFMLSIGLGFVDGFNPCAMWILIYLISILINIKSRKKQFILGISFLFFSAFFYLLAMFGIQMLLGIKISYIRELLGIIILVFGIYNLYKTINEKNGCKDNKDQRKLFRRFTHNLDKKSLGLGILSLFILAVLVNAIELGCSLGFPLIFNEILTINNVMGLKKLFYSIIYVLTYMLDDIIIFMISMIVLQPIAISLKLEKKVNILGGIIMILVGILLLFFPEILLLRG